MAKTQEFDFADPDFNFPEFFESFNIQPETDPFSLGPKPVGVSGAATPSEQAFSAASAVNQNDPTFFQSLIDSGRLRLDDDLPGGGTGTPFGQAGSAIPNYALESAMGAGDGRGGLSGGNVNTRNIGEMFPDFDSLARSVSGFAGGKLKDFMGAIGHHKQRLATEFAASTILSAGMTGPGGLVMGGLVHGVGNVMEADALREAMGIPEATGFIGTAGETWDDFWGRSDVFNLHDIVDTFEDTKGISADLGLDQKEIEQLAIDNPAFLNQVLAAYTGFPDQKLSNRTPFRDEGVAALGDPDPDLAEAILFGFDPADAAAGFEISRGSGGYGGDVGHPDRDFREDRDFNEGPSDIGRGWFNGGQDDEWE
jgi:hypothetical protein